MHDNSTQKPALNRAPGLAIFLFALAYIAVMAVVLTPRGALLGEAIPPQSLIADQSTK